MFRISSGYIALAPFGVELSFCVIVSLQSSNLASFIAEIAGELRQQGHFRQASHEQVIYFGQLDQVGLAAHQHAAQQMLNSQGSESSAVARSPHANLHPEREPDRTDGG